MVIWRMMILQLVMVMVLVATSHANPTSGSCRPDERDALLSFKMGFSILNAVDWMNQNMINGANCPGAYAKTNRWEMNGNCCEWDGVTCDYRTGHVVELDLSCSLLNGGFPNNSTLFLLRRLHHLSLAYNSLSSQIPSSFRHLSEIRSLDLGNAGFSGQVPPEIGWLSHLTSLDLSFNEQLKMPNFQTVIANLTHLRNLDLSFMSIASNLPPMIFNLSKLASRGLESCGLRGEFPYVNTPMLPRVTLIDFSDNMLSGIIPGWIFPLPSLESLFLYDNFFTGISEFEVGNGSSMAWFDADTNHLLEPDFGSTSGQLSGGLRSPDLSA